MTDSVTFIHAADLHLGAPFQGLSSDNDRVGRQLAAATYTAWQRIVDEAVSRGVDFVVLAGDLYDAKDPSLSSQLALREQAQRLDEAGIRLLLVRGNHDPLGGWSAGLRLPDNVFEFPSGHVERVEVVARDGFVCGVYGRSYQVSAESEDFTPGYVRDARDTVAVALLHSNVGNNPDHAPYAPCSLGGLTDSRMDYWALGHIHKHAVLATEPYVVYAGSPQGLNPKETGGHGCCVVTVGRMGVTSFEHVDLAPISWASADVDVSGTDSLDGVEALLVETLEAACESAGRPVVARLRLTGRTTVRSDLTRPGVMAQLFDEVRREAAAMTPWAWPDRLEDRTSAVIDLDALVESPDFAGEVARIAAELAVDAAALDGVVAEAAAPVLTKLPGFVPSMSGAEILAAARDRALDLLDAGDGGES